MFDPNEKKKKILDEDDEEYLESVGENWSPDEEAEDDPSDIIENILPDRDEIVKEARKQAMEQIKHASQRVHREREKAKRERQRIKREMRSARTQRAHIPPLPPVPPIPPLPPEFEISKSEKVIGIRGLDARLYKDIGKIARKNGLSVADLINRLFAKYRYDSKGSNQENGNTISNINTLELYEEELLNLDDEVINIVNVKKLLLSPDISPETFQKIKRIDNIEQIWVPSHLYLLLLKKVNNCYKIEKFKGSRLPQVVTKSFDSDVHLTSSFFEYFLETDQQVDLRVYGELRIDTDITSDDFKQVIYQLAVDGDIQAPKHLIGILYATAKCYGEIEAIED